MQLILSITAGPHQGKKFVFDGHDTFLVGRVNDAHLQLSYDDPFFSRRHFVLEMNPPRCRLMDLESRNGTEVNGQRVGVAEIVDGDVIKAGHTVFEVAVVRTDSDHEVTRDLYETVSSSSSKVMPISVDPTLPGYEIVKELGRGGMGVVYQARRLSDGMMMAVKTIIPALGSSGKQIEYFVREARILEKLHHPNIVGFHEATRDGDTIILAMEFINGPDVGKLLADKGPMDIPAGVRILCQTLSGLQHAHQEGYVHRDIKPSNILIHAEGGKKTAKLADFGLARAYETSRLSGLTLQGDVGGTPHFMPPEQVTHYRDVKPAADQYSAAATLYTMLTGRHVHDLPAGVGHQLVHITTTDVVPIRSRRADLPEGLAAVVHRALRREPGERFADVGRLREELKKWA
jgi:eukaryotic-like serine/threonine-protein kinase